MEGDTDRQLHNENDLPRDSQEKKSALGELQKKLYLKGVSFSKRSRSRLRPHEDDGSSWGEEAEKPLVSPGAEARKALFMKRIFFASLLFFIFTLGISLFVFLGGTNIISSKNVEILVSAPVSIEAGKELTFQIVVENKNSTALESAELRIEYPEGTKNPNNLEEALERTQESLGPIRAGAVATVVKHAVLFGQEGEEKNINVSVEYRLEDSNAIFVSEKTYAVFISASPILLNVGSLKEVNSGKEMEIQIDVISNSNDIVHDLLIRVDYPFGFSFIKAIPEPLYGKDTWKIGDLSPGATRTIILRGLIEGQDGEEKIFRIMSGVQSASDERSIGIAYASLVEQVTIARPFLDAHVSLDGRVGNEYVAENAQTIRGEIVWENNLPTKIVDAQIEARLKGAVLNQSSVSVEKGFYRSFDNTIIWNSGTFGDLSEIESGERGKVTFSFASIPLLGSGASLRNPQIEIEIDVRAKRISEAGVPQEIKSSSVSVVKINTDMDFSQRAVYYTGPFTNTGPIPPIVGEETTYTLVWTLVNSGNTVVGARATATLPPYVRFVGVVSPQSEEIAYVDDRRVARWSLGTVREGTGVSLPPREVVFQVAFLPSISQRGDSPILVSPVQFTGIDQFTNSEIKETARAVTTELSTDPNYNRGDNIVQ